MASTSISPRRWYISRSLAAMTVTIGVGLLFAGGGFLHQSSIGPLGSNRTQSFDFGTQRFGETVKHSFVIRNESKLPRRISRITSTCSCSTAAGIGRIIDAGEAIEIPVEMRLTCPKDRAGAEVLIQFDDGVQIRLSLTGNIARGHPTKINFGEVHDTAKVSRDFSLTSLDDRPIHVERLKFNSRYFRIHKIASDDHRQITFKVGLARDAPVGDFSQQLEIFTDDVSYPVKSVSLMGRVRG